jgi:formylglycine-generating enzyme required for sulfatase activity
MMMGTTRLRRCLLPLLAAGLLGQAASAAPPGMVWVPGGAFLMGEDGTLPEERPVHEVEVDGFFMDRHEVTNRRFLAFVRATGYVTRAERPGPGGEPPGSLVFVAPEGPVSRGEIHKWWRVVPGASWRHPEGPRSGLSGREEHPVVHVAWEDAAAFCAWAGGRLPTEAEWERAARGGLSGKVYTWGDEERPGGRFLANTWQGPFPTRNSAADGWAGTAPVGSYPPNRYGLHDMAGNVWEWTSDWYRHDYYAERERKNPRGPQEARSLDPGEPGVRKRTTRGGSFLCAASHCMRYRPSARSPVEPGTSLSHTGFRCVRDPDRRAREPARP